MTELILIAATSKNNIIAINGKIPWGFFKEDMRRFQLVTSGHPVIMGRKTFETFEKPLPERTNIVVSYNGVQVPEGVVKCQTLEEALEFAKSKDEINYIIGGQTIYDATIDNAARLMLTRVHRSYPYDPEKCRTFPVIDEKIWKKVPVRNYGAYSFVDYARR